MVIKNDLMKKFKKNSTIATSSAIEDSIFFGEKSIIDTGIPALNIALSGDLNGGFQEDGITVLAGKSKSFKTLLALIMAKAYMDKYPEAVLLFYDNEFGMPSSYLNNLKIDMSRVFHTPIENVEQLKFDLVNQLNEITRGEKAIVIVDSLGNISSNREYKNALDQHAAEDMGIRAKSIKSLMRVVTPMLATRNISMVVINHVYDSMGAYSSGPVVASGQGIYYSATNILIVSRSQEKETTGDKKLIGWNFTLTVDKSRYAVEKSKIPITVLKDGTGINIYSGLLENAVEAGVVIKPKNGSYQKISVDGEIDEKVYKEKNTHTPEFWNSILENEKFKDYIKSKFRLNHGGLLEGSSTEIPDNSEDDSEED